MSLACRLLGHRRQIDLSGLFSGALVTCARCGYRSPGRRTYLFGSPSPSVAPPAKWDAHLDCGCWTTFLAKPNRGHLVHCPWHGIQPVMSMFVLDPSPHKSSINPNHNTESEST